MEVQTGDGNMELIDCIECLIKSFCRDGGKQREYISVRSKLKLDVSKQPLTCF